MKNKEYEFIERYIKIEKFDGTEFEKHIGFYELCGSMELTDDDIDIILNNFVGRINDRLLNMRSETVNRLLKYTPNSVKETVDTYADNIFKLSKNIIFVKCYEPFDYTRNLGQLALEITYTDGDKDVLTTKTTKDNVSASFNFKDENEFYLFIKFLEDNKIPRKS